MSFSVAARLASAAARPLVAVVNWSRSWPSSASRCVNCWRSSLASRSSGATAWPRRVQPPDQEAQRAADHQADQQIRYRDHRIPG